VAAKNIDQIKEVFYEALRLEPEERDGYLEQACAGDIAFRIEVESLMISINDATTFLEQPVIGEFSSPEHGWQFKDGQTVSHYKIISPIGTGGMGEVYEAIDERLHRTVALKVLPESMWSNGDRLRRFQREAEIVSALNHPNILTIYEFGIHDDIHLFASEYVKGETLRERLNRGPLPAAEALDVAIQISSALQAAHEASVIHRDIKPENIMIRHDGYVKVLDFGLAKPAGDTEPLERPGPAVLSQPGYILGTTAYMSPEQTRGSAVDGRSDIFSLGIVLYEMLTGSPPFGGETTTDVIAAIIQADPPPPSGINRAVPSDLDVIALRALAKARTDRYGKVEDMLTELKYARRHLDLSTELGLSRDKWYRPISRPLLIAAAVLALAIAGYWFLTTG
jgi:serine/threonine protein kinase